MRILRIPVLVVASMALGACVYGFNIQQLRPDMTQEEVEDRLGSPDGFRRVGDYTVYTYANRRMSGWSWDRADYHVIFDADGRVTEYGPGEIRPGGSPNVITIVPVGG